MWKYKENIEPPEVKEDIEEKEITFDDFENLELHKLQDEQLEEKHRRLNHE